jgi:hypothetical protein
MAKELSDTMTAALRERWVQRQEILHDIGENARGARQAVEKRAEQLGLMAERWAKGQPGVIAYHLRARRRGDYAGSLVEVEAVGGSVDRGC